MKRRSWIAVFIIILLVISFALGRLSRNIPKTKKGAGVHESSADTTSRNPGKQLYTCGMHPQVIEDHPGDCPMCGMKLVPLKLHTGKGDLKQSIFHGAVKRIRPKMMTVGAILAGLIPIMHGTGTGSSVMKRIAAPMVGGVTTSLLLELAIYPVLFYYLKSRHLDPSLEPTSEEDVHETH